MPRLGAHLSAAGGVSRAAAAAGALGCRALQLFLRPPARWAAPPLAAAEAAAFSRAAQAADLASTCFAHAPYLLNPASADETLRVRSVATLADELGRAAALGLAGVVLHPGSAGSGDHAAAEARCRESLAEALELAGPAAARLLLEGAAGGGGQLGTTPAELRRLVPAGADVGLCLDTAHLWAAGYDLLHDGWERALGEVADTWGVGSPDLVHANDTPVELDGRRDRHAPPGEGRLGESFFRRMLADARLADTPLVLEVPPGRDNELIAAALDRLRTWFPAAGPSHAGGQ